MSTDVRWSECSNDIRRKNTNGKSDRNNENESCVTKEESYLNRYRTFIRKNRFFMKLIEDGLCRMVIYTPSRFVQHDEDDALHGSKKKVLPETLYACIHVWSLFNEIVYHGFGDGNGFTVGGILENSSNKDEQNRYKRENTMVVGLRFILSMIECIEPSLEVSAYYKPVSPPSRSSFQQTSTQIKTHQRHMNALSVSAKVEKIKFMCRMGLLGLHFLKQRKRMQDLNESACILEVGSTGILEEGGILVPDECITKTKEEYDRIKKLLYVGKRTGRKMRAPLQKKHQQSPTYQLISNISTLNSSKMRYLLLTIGEILNIYRPYYYVSSSLQIEGDYKENSKQKMLKLWLRSLCIDLLSHQCSKISKAVLVGNDIVDVSSHSTKNELYHRKMKLFLYLLRSPCWNIATQPVAEKVAIVGNYIPIIGKPLAQYLMDVLNYWRQWHFMLESK